ncbi:MAG TPA: hypothetical protein VHL61_10455 [Luteimonas sp.]|jgi:hypothetical protein|nr:hypothetical protein [Luteimonas sp.]
MDDFEHPILRHGRYRLLALSRQPLYSADSIRAYAVTTLAGDRLREEPTLALAKNWMDACIARDARAMPSQSRTARRPRR